MSGSGQNYSKSRVSKSTGTNASFKKDGYGANKPPDSMMPAKEGVTNKKGYSGPNVQHGSF